MTNLDSRNPTCRLRKDQKSNYAISLLYDAEIQEIAPFSLGNIYDLLGLMDRVTIAFVGGT